MATGYEPGNGEANDGRDDGVAAAIGAEIGQSTEGTNRWTIRCKFSTTRRLELPWVFDGYVVDIGAIGKIFCFVPELGAYFNVYVHVDDL